MSKVVWGFPNPEAILVDEAGATAGPKRYVALLSQSGSSDPVVTVLENTLGGVPVWWRPGAGDYYCGLTGAFPADKTVCVTQLGTTGNRAIMFFGRENDDRCRLNPISTDGVGSPVDPQNSPNNDWTVIIEVYP